MSYLLWFSKLRYTCLKNSMFKDSKTTKRTLSIALAIIIGQIVLTRILYRTIFNQLSIADEMVNPIVIVFLFVVVIWIYLISLVQSMNTFIQNFYKSPDMSYLISVPIPFNYVFLSKFFDHIIKSTKSMMFLFFPFLTALGLWVNASLGYYLMIIPLYLFISIIPSIIGVMFSMIGLRFVSAKIFNTIIPMLIFGINVSFAILFTRAQNISTTFIVKLIEFFESPLISDLIPPIAGVKILYSSIVNEWSFSTSFLLFTATSLLVVVAFAISKKLFFEGWSKNQLVESKTNSKKVMLKKGYNVNKKPTFVWIETEWKMAIRNYEMLMGSIFMLLFYVFAVFTLIYGNLFFDNPIIGVSMLIFIASLTNIMAVSIVFIPAEIKKDKNLWKNRYWLLKIMPIHEGNMFNIQLNMFFIPGFIISSLGIIAYSLMSGLNIHMILFSIVSMFFILYGSSAIYVCSELVSLTEFFEKYAFLGNLATFIVPLLYGIFSSGIATLFLAKDLLSDITVLSNINALLSLPIVILVSFITVTSTYVISKNVFISVWRELEI